MKNAEREKTYVIQRSDTGDFAIAPTKTHNNHDWQWAEWLADATHWAWNDLPNALQVNTETQVFQKQIDNSGHDYFAAFSVKRKVLNLDKDDEETTAPTDP